jgi:hypothetical protein
METWAIVAIVLGTNLITNLSTWFLTNRQLTHSDKRLERQLQAQREADKRERRREVRSEPLVKLRDELARMAAKGDRVAYVATPTGYQSKEITEEFTEALDDWNSYVANGEFQRALFMQYDFVLVNKVNEIRSEYNAARYRFGTYWQWLSDADREKGFNETIEMIVRNRERIAKVQSEINKLLEEL